MTTSTTLYSNTKMNALTFSGKSKHDIAHDIFYKKLTPMQRIEVMNKCKKYKSSLLTLRASLNYIADNLEQF